MFSITGDWYFFVIIHLFLVGSYALFVLLNVWRNEHSKAVRKQLIILFCGTSISFFLILFYNVLINRILLNGYLPDLSSSMSVFQTLFFFMAIAKYKLFSVDILKSAEAIFRHVNEQIFILDHQGYIQKYNQACLTFWGEVKGRKLKQILGDNYTYDNDFQNVEIILIDQSGKKTAFLITQNSLFDSHIFIGKLVLLKDITLLKENEKRLSEMNERLTELSMTDPLTGLHNRRYVKDIFFESVNNFVLMKTLDCAKKRNPHIDEKIMGIYLVDIDFFKKINDEYGHDAGDRILVELSKIFRDNIRFDDVIIRWGGEEFLIILSDTKKDYLPIFSKKLKDAVANATFTLSDGRTLSVTISIGCVSFPILNNNMIIFTFEQSINLSDMALSMAKEKGRNRTVYLRTLKDNHSIQEPLDIKTFFNNQNLGSYEIIT